MKNVLILVGIIAILVNSFVGIIFKNYEVFNWISANTVIIYNVMLLQFLLQSKISDGFKIAMSFIFPCLGLITFILSINLEKKLENNYLLLGVIFLLSIQVILLIITKSLKTGKNDNSAMP